MALGLSMAELDANGDCEYGENYSEESAYSTFNVSVGDEVLEA
jgi:hypothetical protein